VLLRYRAHAQTAAHSRGGKTLFGLRNSGGIQSPVAIHQVRAKETRCAFLKTPLPCDANREMYQLEAFTQSCPADQVGNAYFYCRLQCNDLTTGHRSHVQDAAVDDDVGQEQEQGGAGDADVHHFRAHLMIHFA